MHQFIHLIAWIFIKFQFNFDLILIELNRNECGRHDCDNWRTESLKKN